MGVRDVGVQQLDGVDEQITGDQYAVTPGGYEYRLVARRVSGGGDDVDARRQVHVPLDGVEPVGFLQRCEQYRTETGAQ